MLVGLVFALAGAAAGCAGGSAYTSFDPGSPCTTDGRFPGAYPDIEARVPKTFESRPPDSLDSGRNCTAKELGTLAQHGIKEVRYAGGTWNLASNAGVTLAVFTGTGLTAEWLGEWYESSARQATNTRDITATRPTIADRPTYRIDTSNNDSEQTVITFDAAGGDAVYVVVAADAGDERVNEAVAAFP
jgi:hypothetical protein